ncbi:hypothetical protein [Streptomyces sp. NPDC051994]|uniref:hypothetical protein n=1 Tax=unclassified Streptomyces TaxID=2593676 RepID=UPI0034388DDD
MRYRADTINDDELDALYKRLALAEAAVERVMQLGNVLRAADAPDGTPSPLRPAGELIVAVAARTFEEAATPPGRPLKAPLAPERAEQARL